MDTQFCHASVVMDVLVSNRVPIGSSVDCLCVNELKTTAAFINRFQKKKRQEIGNIFGPHWSYKRYVETDAFQML